MSRSNERGLPATSLFPTSAQLEAIERTRAAYDSALAKVDEHIAAAKRTGLTPEQEQVQRDFAATTGLPVDRYEVEPCSACDGRGYIERPDTLSGGRRILSRYECEHCDETGVTLRRTTARYEPVPPATVGAPKGELLPTPTTGASEAKDWARVLAAAEGELDASDQRSLRDWLVRLAAGLDEHRDQLDEAASARELRDDARDDEVARLNERIAELELELAGAQAELEAGRAAVVDAAGAVLDAGAALTEQRGLCARCRGQVS